MSGLFKSQIYGGGGGASPEDINAAVAAAIAELTVADIGGLELIDLGSVATTSGTSKGFFDLPDNVVEVIFGIHGVGTNGSSNILLQIGDAGGVENTDYFSGYEGILTSGATGSVTATAGFLLSSMANTRLLYGHVRMRRIDDSINLWSVSGFLSCDDGTDVNFANGGNKAISAVLDRVQLTTANGTDAFRAGIITAQILVQH
jgi:hypothetical protein